MLAAGYVTLLADGKRLRELGLDARIRVQEQRAATSFACSDIHCPPYDVPRE